MLQTAASDQVRLMLSLSICTRPHCDTDQAREQLRCSEDSGLHLVPSEAFLLAQLDARLSMGQYCQVYVVDCD